MPLGKRQSTVRIPADPQLIAANKNLTGAIGRYQIVITVVSAVMLMFVLSGLTHQTPPTQSKLSYSAACTTAAYPCQKKPNYVDGVGLQDIASTQRVYSTR